MVVLYIDFLLLLLPPFYFLGLPLFDCSSMLYGTMQLHLSIQFQSSGCVYAVQYFPVCLFSISISPWTPGESNGKQKKNMAQPNNNAIQFQSSGWSLSFYLSVVLFFFSLSFILFLSGNIIPTIVHRHHNTTIVRESIRSLALSPLIGLHLNNSKWINRHYLNLSRSRLSFLFPYSYS